MNLRTMKMALAAAVILIVLGGISLWPFGGSNSQWWQGAPAAWARELQTALGTIQAVSYRERTILVSAYGSEHLSSTWDIFYVSKDSYRRDIYDDVR